MRHTLILFTLINITSCSVHGGFTFKDDTPPNINVSFFCSSSKLLHCSNLNYKSCEQIILRATNSCEDSSDKKCMYNQLAASVGKTVEQLEQCQTLE